MIEFEWDSYNIKHVIEDYPSRENTISEVESVFLDPFVIYRKGNHVAAEQRYRAIGLSNLGRINVVIFTVSNEKIRPISSWPANTQTRRLYHERAKN